MKLYARDLQAAKACPEQVALFRAHFGDGGTVTLAKVRKVAGLFSWDWAARFLLSPASWAEYKRVTVPARAEYERVIASAWAQYERVIVPAWAQYGRVRASAWFAGWKRDQPIKLELETSEAYRARITAAAVAAGQEDDW